MGAGPVAPGRERRPPLRVLLVYFNRARDLLPAPPIGLAYVATATRRAGHEVAFLDLLDSRQPAHELRTAVRRFAPEVVGISVRNIDNVVRQRPTWHLGELGQLLAALREESRAPIVLGGPAVSILGAAVLNRLDADFALLGEGEEAFPRFLATLAARTPFADVPGLYHRTDGHVTGSPPARLAAFGASGMEEWIDWPAYERMGATWTIQTKRGCPLHCSYCAYPAIEGPHHRRRTPADIVDEIERVQSQMRPRTFEFVDSTFNVPRGHAEAVCQEILARELRVNLTAMGVNPLGVSETLFALMRRAGFVSMMITAEAASDTMLRNLGKGFTTEDVRRTAALARQSGIACAWFFMLGGPGETRATVDETLTFVEEHLNWPRCLSIFMTGIRVLPGTAIVRTAEAERQIVEGQDLSAPTFYLSSLVDEAWILSRINQAVARCPGIVHAAEEGRSVYERAVDWALYRLGIAPPFWRFLPVLLRVPPMPALRRRYPPLLGKS